MPNVAEVDERRAYIESIVSALGPGRVSQETAERNLASLDLESLAQLSSRLLDARERASAMVQTPGALMRKETHSQNQGLSTVSHAAADSLVDVLFKLRAERAWGSVQQLEISYASRVVRLLKMIGSQGNDQDLLRCHRDYVPLYLWVENLYRDPVYDPRLEFFRVLALSQRRLENEVLRTDSGFWNELLWKTPSILPLAYAEVALLGLVASVRPDSDSSVASVLDAFCLWTRNNHLSEPWRDFLASRLVADIGTHMPADLAEMARNAEPTKAAPYSILKTLVSHISNKETETTNTAHLRGRQLRRRDVEDIIKGFQSSPFELSRQAVENVRERCIHEAISRRNGTLLRAFLSRLGDGLLNSFAFANNPRMYELVCELALDCIRWEPQHIAGWTLWVNALKRRGDVWATEMVMWEKLRRFPHRPAPMGQLGAFLEQQGRREQAKAVLIENIQRFPKRWPGYRILANLLVRSFGDLKAAVAVIDESIENGVSPYKRDGLIQALKRLKKEYERSGPPDAKPATKDPDIERVSRRLPLGEMAFLNGECVRLEFLLSHPELEQSVSARQELESLAFEADFPFASFLLLKNGIMPPGHTEERSRPFGSHFSLRSVFVSLLVELAEPGHVNWSRLYQMARSGEALWLIRVAENLLEDQPLFGDSIDVGTWVKGSSRGEYEISDVLRERLRALVNVEKREDEIATRLKEQRRAISSALSDVMCWDFYRQVA